MENFFTDVQSNANVFPDKTIKMPTNIKHNIRFILKNELIIYLP